MSAAFHISPVNPIRFFASASPVTMGTISDIRDVPISDGDRYVQKYSPKDYTSIQVCSNDSAMNFTLDVLDRYGKWIRNVSRQESILENIRFSTFQVYFTGLNGCVRLRLTVGYGYGYSEIYESALLHVSQKNESLTLLQYRNTENMDGVDYSAVDIFTLRVEGGFQMKNYAPKSNDTIYRNVDLRFEMLHSDTYHTRKFIAGGTRGIPDEFHYTIHKAFGCDTVYIDGAGYIKYEGAGWEASEADHHPLRSWTIELIGNGDVYTPKKIIEYQWFNYTCRIQNDRYTGYAAAINLEAGGKVFSILSELPGYAELNEYQYAILSIGALNNRAVSFINYVEWATGGNAIPGLRNTVKIPINLISGEYNLVSGEYNLITSASVIEGLIIPSDKCSDDITPPKPSPLFHDGFLGSNDYLLYESYLLISQ